MDFIELLVEALPFFEAVELSEFLTGEHWTPLREPRHFGVLPLVGGTLLVEAVDVLHQNLSQP